MEQYGLSAKNIICIVLGILSAHKTREYVIATNTTRVQAS